MVNKEQNQALYPVLQHYTGSQITSISSEDGILFFNTLLGLEGRLLENKGGDWNIIIGEEVVEIIEKEVFDILVNPNKKSSLEDYLFQLNKLISSNIKYRSKTLVSEILRILEEYILNSDFVPKIPLVINPFFIFNHKGMRMVNCLN